MGRARFVLAAVAFAVLAISTPSQSDDSSVFKGPGWYVIDNNFGPYKGPYASESDCRQHEEEKTDICKYLESESDVDHVYD